MLRRIKQYYKRNNGFTGTIKAIFELVKTFGVKNVFQRFLGKDIGYYTDYQYWIENIEKKYNSESVQAQLNSFEQNPKISVLIPVYNVESEYLIACIDSVRNQYYENWELCIADDHSSKEHVRHILEEYIQKDERIKVVFRQENGHISEATNSALAIATGEYIALLDNDDILKPEALLEIVQVINNHDYVDMIYSDEDKIDADGMERVGPSFKPDWSPDAFLSHMYLCHLGVYRTSIARDIGGFRTEYNGSQDYDFALRFSEQTKYIYHAPYILYHWRMIPTSTAMNTGSKNYAFDASVKAKMSAAERRGFDADIIPFEEEFATNFVFKTGEKDFVSIIIYLENTYEILEKTLNSLEQVTQGIRYEILIATNKKNEKLNKIDISNLSVRIFNYSPETTITKMLNETALHAQGNLYLFMNDNMQFVNANWLQLLAGQAKQEYTGAVGGKVLDKEKLVQQAGIIILNDGNKPVYAFSRYSLDSVTYLGRIKLNYNYTAIGNELLMIGKAKFDKVQGFDENYETSEYFDIDLCLKLLDKGYFNVCRGDVEVFCFAKRKYDELLPLADTEAYQKLLDSWYFKYLKNDLYYNTNLSQKEGNFAIRRYK